MPIPRHRFAQVRQALGTRRDSGGDNQHVYARARLASVELTESYSYEQEISRNPAHGMTKDPAGHIELTLPFDGHDHFTRQACADVERQAHSASAEAVVGHLALTNWSKTDLSEVLGLSGNYGTIPIKVPIGGGNQDLRSDSRVCVIEHDYTPNRDSLEIVPIDVHVTLEDTDGIELAGLLAQETSVGDKLVDDVANRITQQVGFRPFLQLNIEVSIYLPKRAGASELRPVVTRVALRWPTITSLSVLKLDLPGQRDALFRYNPPDQRIEWFDVPMWLADVPTDEEEDEQLHGDMLAFRSGPMVLRVEQPGELYKQPSLDGEIEVQVPGLLLSGVQARGFNAVGTRPRSQPEVSTTITTDLHVILDDAFASRLLMPYQHLYFDEVIPDERRITDIVTALRNKGFTIKDTYKTQPAADVWRHLLVAEKAAGPDVMRLWVFAESKRFETERRKQTGGQTFKSTFDSGDLKVFMRGEMPGTSRELTHVMNALELELRETFERLKARR
jgi:hypothetical protein